MKKNKNARFFRKTHRYLGLFLGIQFILWTISGLYFSWTDIDEIHGDQFKALDYEPTFYNDLFPLSHLDLTKGIQKLEFREINDTPFYWINEEALFNAKTGETKDGISEQEAIQIAQNHMQPNLVVDTIELIEETGMHHEYRGRTLPAYVITYTHPDQIKAYVSIKDGKFQTVRHRNWRWFDFLWMTHTMDYNGRDNFNTYLLRTFSLLGLITVLSGFIVWFVTSPITKKRFSKKA